MKIKSLALLLMTSFLVPSMANAAGGLSDASNGLIPEDTKKYPARLKSWQEDMRQQLAARADVAGIIYDQADRHFASLYRKGDKETRTRADAVCDFLEKRGRKLQHLSEHFEGHQGVDVCVESADMFQDGEMNKTGRHIAMVRKVEALREEIVEIGKKITSQPGQKAAWERDIQNKEGELGRIQSALESRRKQLEEEEGFLREQYKAAGNRIKEAQDVIDQSKEKAREENLKGAFNLDLLEDAGEKQKEVKDCIQEIDEDRSQFAELDGQVNAFENQEREGQLKIKALEKEIQNLRELIEGQDQEAESLRFQCLEKEKEKKEVQDAADAYALVKYISYLNIYVGLPHDDFGDENGHELSALSPYITDLVNRLGNTWADKVAKHYVQEKVIESTELYDAVVKDVNEGHLKASMVYTEKEKIFHSVLLEVKSTQTGAASLNSNIPDVVRNTFKKLASIMEGAKYREIYEEAYPDRFTCGKAEKLEGSFHEENKEELDRLRADRIIKASMEKWLSKISVGEDSLVHRLGLDSALFNNDFTFQIHPRILSLEEFQVEFATLGEDSGKMTTGAYAWDLGVEQLSLNNAELFVDGDKKDITYRRITPIHQFLQAKNKKFKPEQKVGFEEKWKGASPKEHKELIKKSFLKTVSYMNMFYALHHDGNGGNLPEFKSVAPAMEPYLKEPFPKESRLDYVVGSKALKWAQRVHEYGQDFIDANGLRAHTFLNFSAPQKELGKNEKGKEKDKDKEKGGN